MGLGEQNEAKLFLYSGSQSTHTAAVSLLFKNRESKETDPFPPKGQKCFETFSGSGSRTKQNFFLHSGSRAPIHFGQVRKWHGFLLRGKNVLKCFGAGRAERCETFFTLRASREMAWLPPKGRKCRRRTVLKCFWAGRAGRNKTFLHHRSLASLRSGKQGNGASPS